MNQDGRVTFWNEIDHQLKKFDYHEVNLLPIKLVKQEDKMTGCQHGMQSYHRKGNGDGNGGLLTFPSRTYNKKSRKRRTTYHNRDRVDFDARRLLPQDAVF